jgi:hypothetical protein
MPGKPALSAALQQAMELRGQSAESLGSALGYSGRAVRRWLSGNVPLEQYLAAARVLESQPMVDALLRAYGLPTAGDQLEHMARAYGRAMRGHVAVWRAIGYDVTDMGAE